MGVITNKYFSFTFLLLFIAAQNCFAQNPDIKRTWHWYFGYGAGIDFSSGIAVPDSTGNLFTTEGCASISDTSGNLLFYTDGDTVWDSNHLPMSNGLGLLGCGNVGSSAQAAIIIPHPGNANLFYIITNDCGENACVNGLRYSIVDITLNGGFGDVTVKNNLLFAPGTEALAVTKHYNKKYYWMVSHQYQNNNFMVYLIDSTGLNTTPIMNSIGSYYNYGYNSLKFSTDGNKLVTAIFSASGINDLFDFDTHTGTISNLIQLTGQSGACYGPEFSFDNTKLYYSDNGNVIFQYDISSGIDSIINNSKTTIAAVSDNSTFGGLQKGPDNKLYIASFYFDSISTIDCPNNYGAACNLHVRNFYLKRNSGAGMPNFVSNYFDTTNNSNCLTAVNEIANSDFNFYPNPTHDKLYVEGKAINKVILYDMSGRIFSQFKPSLNSQSFIIDVSKLARGIYILSLQTKNQFLNKKLILN